MIEGPRRAKLDDLPQVIHLVNEVFMTGLDAPRVLGEFFPQLFNEHNIENLRVMFENGKPISHVGIWEGDLLIYGTWFKVGMIGCVCTHQDYRGRGYASALMKDALLKMEKDGVEIAFVTGFRNLYRRAGYVEAGRVHVYHLLAGSLCSRKERFRVTPYTPDKIQELVDIYQREPVRYRRNLEDWKILLERDLLCRDIFLRTFAASKASKPIAYISVGLVPDEKEVRVFEYGGSARAVLHLLENVSATMRIDTMQLDVPFQDFELLNLLERQGLGRPSSEAQMATAILDPESFLEKAIPYLDERIGRQRPFQVELIDAGKLRLKIRGEETELDPEAFTVLFFGRPEKLKSEGQPEMDLEQTLGLAKALPLPTPTFGLTYV